MVDTCILITVYNGAPWIDEALDSALQQRGVSVEVLVVDDGSTDTTPEILASRRAAAPERIRVIRIPQSGLSRARNIGFDNIDSEFTCCLDADDRMHPLRAKIETEALRQYPKAVLSFSGRWNFADGHRRGSFAFTPESFGATNGDLFAMLQDPLSAMLEAGEYPGTDACTCRTSWAREEGRFREDMRSFVDGERWIRCMYKQTAVYCAAPLYLRREHDRAMSAAAPDVPQNMFRAIDEARVHWDDYSERQRRLLDDFEVRAGTWIARRATLSGDRWSGLVYLLRHAPRLFSRRWLRVLLFVFTPGPVDRLWRHCRGYPTPGQRALTDLSVVLSEDPQAAWSTQRPTNLNGAS